LVGRDHGILNLSFLRLQSIDLEKGTVVLLLLAFDCGALKGQGHLGVSQNLTAVRVRQDAQRGKE